MIRVLVADHQPIVNYGIRMLFENSNDIKIVSTVNTAKQLINYLKKGSADLVLMSMDLPDMNGITVLRSIKKNHNNVRVSSLAHSPKIFMLQAESKLELLDFCQKQQPHQS